jgi:antitoxin ParD1/3/4
MNISLTSELEAWVQAKVESGMYSSASEVIREALRLQAQFDHARSEQLGKLNAVIDAGLHDIDTGRLVDADESRSRIEKRRQSRRSA